MGFEQQVQSFHIAVVQIEGVQPVSFTQLKQVVDLFVVELDWNRGVRDLLRRSNDMPVLHLRVTLFGTKQAFELVEVAIDIEGAFKDLPSSVALSINMGEVSALPEDHVNHDVFLLISVFQTPHNRTYDVCFINGGACKPESIEHFNGAENSRVAN